jgi:anti-sigma factor RsiW
VSHPTFELTAFVDGALPPERVRFVRHHLAACPACAAEEGRLRDALALLAALPPAPTPSPFFGARLEQRLRAERAARDGFLGRVAALRWRLAVPAAALGAAAVLIFGTAARVRGRERAMAEHLELLEDYDAIASLGDLESSDDIQVVAHLDDLQGGGRP